MQHKLHGSCANETYSIEAAVPFDYDFITMLPKITISKMFESLRQLRRSALTIGPNDLSAMQYRHPSPKLNEIPSTLTHCRNNCSKVEIVSGLLVFLFVCLSVCFSCV